MKLNEIFEIVYLTEMPHEDALIAQRVLKSVFMKYLKFNFDMSQHFDNRILDKGEMGRREHGEHAIEKDADREKDTTKDELFYLFGKFLKNPSYRKEVLSHKQWGKEIEGIITDRETNVNVVFKVAYQFRTKHPLFRVITIKRKRDFKAKNPNDLRFYV